MHALVIYAAMSLPSLLIVGVLGSIMYYCGRHRSVEE